MGLQASGPISFGDINVELSQANTNTSLNDSSLRGLAGVSSGPISLYDFYNKSSVSGQVVLLNANVETDWVVPTGVTSISGVAIGSGQWGGTYGGFENGGNGGALAYRNNIPVTPGETLKYKANSQGTNSGGNTYLARGNTILLMATGGTAHTLTGCVGDAYFLGGTGGAMIGEKGGGGGGAAGYAGNGGDGGPAYVNGEGGEGNDAAANSGGGAGGCGAFTAPGQPQVTGSGGGGVGLLGLGTTGVWDVNDPPASDTDGQGGGGGSGGQLGGAGAIPGTGNQRFGFGGTYGGGSGGIGDSPETKDCWGGAGAIRLIWGSNRSYPSTNVADV